MNKLEAIAEQKRIAKEYHDFIINRSEVLFRQVIEKLEDLEKEIKLFMKSKKDKYNGNEFANDKMFDDWIFEKIDSSPIEDLLEKNFKTFYYINYVPISLIPKSEQSLPISSIALSEPHTHRINCIALTSDDNYIISGSKDSTIKIWHIPSQLLVSTLQGHQSAVLSLAVTHMPKYIISGSEDLSIKIWEFNTKSLISSLECHKHPVNGIAITNDDKSMITVSWGVIRFWSIEEKTILYELNCNAFEQFLCVTLTSDNKYALTGSSYKKDFVRVWDLELGKEKFFIKNVGHKVVAVTHNGKYVFAGTCTKVGVWVFANKKKYAEYNNNETVTSISITNDDKFCVSATTYGDISLWNIKEKNIARVLALGGCIHAVAVSHDLKSIICARSEKFNEPGFVKVLSLDEGTDTLVFSVVSNHNSIKNLNKYY